MKKLLGMIIKHPVTITMIVILLTGLGIISTMGMKINLLPDINIPVVSVIVTYPGVSARTVEDTVTSKLSDSLGSMPGMGSLTTYSYDNISACILEFDYGVSAADKAAEVRQKVAGISLPDGCGEPEVSTVDFNESALATLYVTDPAGVSEAYKTADKLRGSLLGIDGVGSVNISGNPEYEITITPYAGLESATLLFIQQLALGAYDLPLGSITVGGEVIGIRNLSDVKSIDEIAALPIAIPSSGTLITSLETIKSAMSAYEESTPEEFAGLTADVLDLARFISGTYEENGSLTDNGLEQMTADEVDELAENLTLVSALINLVENNSAASLNFMWSTWLKNVVENLPADDGELQNIADDYGVSYELLAFLRDDGAAKWAVIVRFRSDNPGELTDDQIVDLFIDLEVFEAGATRGEIQDAINLSRQVNGAGLTSIAGKKRAAEEKAANGEEPDDADEVTNTDYAFVFYGSSMIDEHPYLASPSVISAIRYSDYDGYLELKNNLDTLNDFKAAHPGELTDEAFFELYGSLSTGDDLPVVSLDLIGFIRGETDFSDTTTGSDGNSYLIVRLGDIANIKSGTSYNSYAYYNGVQGVMLEIYKTADGNGTAIVSAVKDEYARLAETVDSTIVLTDDQSQFISESISNILSSMLIGGLLAVLIIYLFLKKVKPSLIIAITMPLSVLAALSCLFLLGITLNMVSLGGLAVGIGMLVDNSIVVIEAIFSHRDMGKNAYIAARDGTAEVGGALLGSTLTTVCVFIPILFIGGLTAEIFTDLSFAVIFSLSFSLLVALFVIPTLYCLVYGGRKHFLTGRGLNGKTAESAEQKEESINTPEVLPPADPGSEKQRLEKGENRFVRWWHRAALMRGFEGLYTKILPKVLTRKWLVVIVAVIVFGASIGLVFTTGFDFLPAIDKGLIEVSISYDATVTLDEANADTDKFLASLGGISDIDGTSVSVGFNGLLALSNTSVIDIYLSGNAKKTSEVVEDIRELALAEKANGNLSGVASVKEIDGVVATITGGISDLSLTIKGKDTAVLKEICGKIETELSSDEMRAKGFRSVSNSMSDTATGYEIDFEMYELAKLGLDYQTVVMTLRVGLAGYTAAVSDIGGQEHRIIVRFEDDTISSYDDLTAFVIGYDNDGNIVRLRDVAAVRIAEGVESEIRKSNGENLASITAQVYRLDSGTAGDLMKKAAGKVLEDYEGYSFSAAGVSSYLDSAFMGLAVALIISFFLLFAVMAAQFESVTKPLIILASIPFSFTGGFLAIVMSGMSLNVVSFIGIIMLMGVIVNNAIVMLEKIEQLHKEGMPHYEAVLTACKVRLRPILMTTLTTILALVPLALGIGSGSELMQPLGIVVIGGLLIGTLVTLLLIPTIYCLVKRLSKDNPEGVKK